MSPSPLPELHWNQFYRFANGTLLLPGCAWEQCDDMYYNLTSGGVELLSLDINGHRFHLINPTDFPNPPRSEDEPFDTSSFFAVLFRLNRCCPEDLFCISGSTLSGDDFKKVYDENGFMGLCFETVWEG